MSCNCYLCQMNRFKLVFLQFDNFVMKDDLRDLFRSAGLCLCRPRVATLSVSFKITNIKRGLPAVKRGGIRSVCLVCLCFQVITLHPLILSTGPYVDERLEWVQMVFCCFVASLTLVCILDKGLMLVVNV